MLCGFLPLLQCTKNPPTTLLFTLTCTQPSVTDQDKQTPPPDSVVHTISAAEINPHTQAELYTAYQAPSVSGDMQTESDDEPAPEGP